MIIIKTLSEIHEYISKIHDHKTIGFVPTMGSFHEGHISLIKKCVEENKESICSLFVNPKQFNEKEDYENYPYDLNKDIKILSKTKCKVLLAAQMVESIVRDQKRIFPCCCWLTGQYGMKDIYLGVPCKLGSNGIEEILELKLNEKEMLMLNDSAKSVRGVLSVLDEMNLF